MVDNSCIIEGNVKFRDGRKWKSRWCVMRKLSPVADCLHLQLYGDSKDRYKQGQTKASLSLQHFLGVQSGFTLDKESNTIAIICQDVTVVLAFDTRERLIQWQVKISNNLGEDQKFLILISSAPSKAKLPNGPAYLHVQDYRFCIAVGVPPRLAGVWEIAHLRRYGVIEGRFCFEGGSRCGRGEGLHVLKSDQGDDIMKTFQLAAEGKLATRKRFAGREQSSVQDSPRRQFSHSETRASDFFPLSVYSVTSYEDNHCESYKNESSTCWSSTESRQETVTVLLDGDYGCRDSVSVSTELNEQPSDWHSCSFSRQGTASLERCVSCISKLGATSISKSSTSGTVTTTTSGFGTTSSPGPVISNCSTYAQPRAFDRLSLSSYSSSSHDSDYSVSQQADCHYSSQQSTKSAQMICRSSPSPLSLPPPRPPKLSPCVSVTTAATTTAVISTTTTTTTATAIDIVASSKKAKKAPMPLPDERRSQTCTCLQKSVSRSNSGVGSSYENYDVPKSILAAHRVPPPPDQPDGYYDTPRKIKECLGIQKSYPNYDIPLTSHIPQSVLLQQQCGCPARLTSQISNSTLACPCPKNVMSWAGFVLPYCRRGAGIEPTATTVTVQPIKLSGEGKMPVVNASGEISIYNRNSTAKQDDEMSPLENKNAEYMISNNYENVENVVIHTQPKPNTQTNYENINFEQSLEHYENSKDLLAKSGLTREVADKESTDQSKKEMSTPEVCHKCGHVKDKEKRKQSYSEERKEKTNNQTLKKPNVCSKEVLLRLCNGVKSSSNPTLSCFSPLENTRKRSDSEYRIPGSAMLSSPYLRRRLLDDDSAGRESGSILMRKRSYSAESAQCFDDENRHFSSNNLTIHHKCSSEIGKTGLLVNEREEQNYSICQAQKGSDEFRISPQPMTCIKIRRSSSVPSKTSSHNRDSSSSNDSGVSTGSLSHRTVEAEFGTEYELPMTPSTTCVSKKQQNALSIFQKNPPPVCFHNSLPRQKSKSSDPLRELSFQFVTQKTKVPTKSSSAEADFQPTSLPAKGTKTFGSPGENPATPYIDSRSTSSGTSDMSDYIETLSLSSHSSSDTPDSLRLGSRGTVTTTLRPRSGKEYYKIDRSILVVEQRRTTTSMSSSSSNYANITPVLEKSESPSPGYMSSSPLEQPQPARVHFLFPDVRNPIEKTS